MGNTPSDSLHHSFKRLRLSHTEELSFASPASTSPRRKLAMNVVQHFGRNFDSFMNVTGGSSPVLSCNNFISNSTAVLSSFESLQLLTNESYGEDTTLEENHTPNPALRTISFIDSKGVDSENGELTDKEIIAFLRSLTFTTDLSDVDIIDCLKQEHAKTQH